MTIRKLTASTSLHLEKLKVRYPPLHFVSRKLQSFEDRRTKYPDFKADNTFFKQG